MGANRKKAFEVLPMKRNLMGVEVDGKMYKFGKNPQVFTVHDAGVARQIEDMYGSHSKTGTGDVVVCEVDNAQGLVPRRVFGVPELPWKRGEE